MPKQINLDEAVTHLRELLYMSKAELLRETGFECGKTKKPHMILFAFERKFNAQVSPPPMDGTKRIHPFNARFGKGT